MYKHPLFIFWSLLLVAITMLHLVALELYLYWVYSWFDIMMHFLGGLFIGLSTLWFFLQSGYVRMRQSLRNVILIAGSSIILVGVGWEIFEVLAGIPIEENFALDTTIDLIMDAIGAFVAGYVFTKLYITTHDEKNGE